MVNFAWTRNNTCEGEEPVQRLSRQQQCQESFTLKSQISALMCDTETLAPRG